MRLAITGSANRWSQIFSRKVCYTREMSITEDQKIAILVYHEDHPDAYPPEISEATGISYRNVRHILKEHAASKQRFEINIKTQFDSHEKAERILRILKHGEYLHLDAEIEDVTPCAFKINHGPGHQSETYCEVKGPHETHGMTIGGEWEEFDQEGKHVS